MPITVPGYSGTNNTHIHTHTHTQELVRYYMFHQEKSPLYCQNPDESTTGCIYTSQLSMPGPYFTLLKTHTRTLKAITDVYVLALSE